MEAMGLEGSSLTASPPPPPPTPALLHRTARQVQKESPGLKQSRLRGSGPGRSQEEGEVDDSPDVPLLSSRSETPWPGNKSQRPRSELAEERA